MDPVNLFPETSLPFELVVAHDSKFGIAAGGNIPWRLPTDMRHFRKVTTDAPEGTINAVFMGRKTWQTLPVKFRPLPDRLNVVLTAKGEIASEIYSLNRRNIWCASDLDHMFLTLDFYKGMFVGGIKSLHKIFCIGGAEIYRQALQDPACVTIHSTVIHGDQSCDQFIPDYTRPVEAGALRLIFSGPTIEENGYTFHYETWMK